jgi:dTDP-4-amino-4,6-dideoxygalactose transaminase
LIAIGKPFFDEEEIDAVTRVLRSGWVMQGPEVAAFEAELAAFTGVAAPRTVCVSSGTAALHLALLALGIGPGDEVVTVSHSFIATANAITFTGARPIFVDIESTTYNIDPALIEAAITPRTRAILCVHQMGLPCDLDAVVEIARSHGLFLVEDAACALGAEHKGARIGKPRGDLVCFSFHPRKLVTTGDGGAVIAASDELAARVRRLRQHGMAQTGAPAEIPALNYRLTDLQAAVGRVQLARLPAALDERAAQAARYGTLLGAQVILPVDGAPEARTNWQSFCVRTRHAAHVLAALETQGISARPGLTNAHEEPAYRHLGVSLPVSEAARRECVLLPMGPGLTAADQERVASTFLNALVVETNQTS